jgi:uncharacterized membrane protein YhfC
MNWALGAALLLAASAHVAAPVALGSWLHVRLKVPWRCFLAGAIACSASELAIVVPASSALHEAGLAPDGVAWLALFFAANALLDQGARYLGLRLFLARPHRTWASSLMYGLGQGGLENIVLFGLPSLVGFLNTLLIGLAQPQDLGLPAAEAAELSILKAELLATTPWQPLLSLLQRLLLLCVQCSLATLTLQVFLRRSWQWFAYAASLHYASLLAPALAATLMGPVASAGAAIPAGAIAVYALARLRPVSRSAS